jgi:TolB-like protein/Flp pilus assembly protein TadD
VKIKKYIAELKRRNVFKPAIAYLVVAWLIVQVADIVLATFDVPSYIMKTLIFVLIIGFPLSLIFSWVYEITPKGIKKTKQVKAQETNTSTANFSKNKNSKKLAVLPFRNLGAVKESDYFSDGLTEEIIIRLSGIKNLEIASRSTSMQYKDSKLDIAALGRELNARYLLQGTVRRNNGDLRISTELIDVRNDTELWAEIYNGNMTDVFEIQEMVSKHIVRSLELSISHKEKAALKKRATTNSEAFDAYLRARQFLFRYTKSYLLLSVNLFQQALDIDPKYAAAYAGMSEAYGMLYETHDKIPKWLERAEQSALKALIYDPGSSEAYSALGLVYYNRNSLDEALLSVQKAISFDPDNFFAYWIRGRLYRMQDRDSEAVVDFYKVLDLNPNFHSAYGDLQMSYEKLEDKEMLQDTIQRAALFYPKYLLHEPEDARAHQFYAFTLERLGRREEAVKEMRKGVEINPDDLIIIYNAACFYALLGDKTRSIEHLKKAVENGFRNFEYIRHDPDLYILQEEPAFIELIHGKE